MVSKARSVTTAWLVTLTAVLCVGLVALLDAPASNAASLFPDCAWSSQVGNGGSNGYDADLNATYWVTSFFATTGAGITVSGGFPDARYMSIGAYDTSGPASGVHFYDAQIQPATGVNRFQSGVSTSGTGTYQVQILAQAAPANPAPNTLYVGANNSLVYVLYRIYDSTSSSDPTGGVGIPTVSDTFRGKVTTTYNACVSGSALGLKPAGSGSPFASIIAADAQAAARLFPNQSRAPLAAPTWGVDNVTRLPNPDATYLQADIDQYANQIVVARVEVPTFPDTNNGDPPWDPTQVRYWSVCVDGVITETVSGCVADHAVVESGGVATFVISTAANQPTNATPANGVNWIPWGTASPGVLVYRQILAAPSFGQSIAAIPAGGSPSTTMGPYLPQVAYCSVSEFQSAGAAGCLPATG